MPLIIPRKHVPTLATSAEVRTAVVFILGIIKSIKNKQKEATF